MLISPSTLGPCRWFQPEKSYPNGVGYGKMLWILTGWWFHPLWKIWKSVRIIIPKIWKNKSHVPNHQPVCVCIYIPFYLPCAHPPNGTFADAMQQRGVGKPPVADCMEFFGFACQVVLCWRGVHHEHHERHDDTWGILGSTSKRKSLQCEAPVR